MKRRRRGLDEPVVDLAPSEPTSEFVRVVPAPAEPVLDEPVLDDHALDDHARTGCRRVDRCRDPCGRAERTRYGGGRRR